MQLAAKLGQLAEGERGLGPQSLGHRLGLLGPSLGVHHPLEEGLEVLEGYHHGPRGDVALLAAGFGPATLGMLGRPGLHVLELHLDPFQAAAAGDLAIGDQTHAAPLPDGAHREAGSGSRFALHHPRTGTYLLRSTFVPGVVPLKGGHGPPLNRRSTRPETSRTP